MINFLFLGGTRFKKTTFKIASVVCIFTLAFGQFFVVKIPSASAIAPSDPESCLTDPDLPGCEPGTVIPEICDDTIDNNGNGDIDCDDSECADDDACTLDEPFCGDSELNRGEVCDYGLEDNCSLSCNAYLPQEGDLLITEVMSNPSLAKDMQGEWFEIFNSSNKPIDLLGCVFSDSGSDDFTISKSFVAAPGEYYTFGNNGDELENGGYEYDYVYGSFKLANSDDEIFIECNDIVIDSVEYNSDFPLEEGKSMILKDNSLDNSQAGNWCLSTSIYGDGDLGTPGSQNDECASSDECSLKSLDQKCDEQKDSTVVNAWKVVCESEDLLPNWGEGDLPGGLVTQNTAKDFVDKTPGCYLEPNWGFQWNYNIWRGNGDFYGPLDDWNNFDSTTGLSEPASVAIDNSLIDGKLWFREILQEGYIPYAFPPKPSKGDLVSAELYCHDDVLNYDNMEWIDWTPEQESYNCVAFNVPEYCGDGIVNQDWEECDDGEDSESCYACQTQDNECSDITLARINVDNFENKSEKANVSDRIYLGQSGHWLPDSAWFPVYNNGDYLTDPDVSGYEDVPGLAVERQEGSLRVVLHGSLGSKDKEHIDGTIDFYNASVSDVRSDKSGNNKLEKGFDGVKKVKPGQDEVSNAAQVEYWLTTNTADDGFFADWDVEEDCEDQCTYSINGYKYNSLTEDPIAGWEFELRDLEDNFLASTTSTDNGWYSFDNLCVGEYRVYEEQKTGWSQNRPMDPNYHTATVVEESEDKVGGNTAVYDFENSPQICGYKYNYYTEEGVSDWDIYLKQKTECSEGEEWADRVVSYDNNGTSMAAGRDLPEKSLGAPDSITSGSFNFVSLGLGGSLVLEFDNLIVNGPGDDVKVYETSWGDPSCKKYPEYIKAYASKNGTDWTFLGGPDCQFGDSTFDLGSLDWAKYIKLVDETTKMPKGDGYDVDAVEALHCAGWEVVDETITNDSGLYCFDAEVGDYTVEEGTRDGWEPYGEISYDVAFDGTAPVFYNFTNIPPKPVDGSIKVCKYDEQENPLSGWTMSAYGNTNLVENGSFEEPVVKDHGGKWELFGANLVNWAIGWMDVSLDEDPALELQTSKLWSPQSGDQYAELDTHNSSRKASVMIDQDLNTEVGKSYKLSFAYSARPGIADNKLRVEFGDVDATLDVSGVGKNNTEWTYYTYTTVADSASTNLKFSDLGKPDTLGTFIDDVSVVEMEATGDTGEDGCVRFENMPFGEYLVYEDMKDGWARVSPKEEYFNVVLSEENIFEELSFVNRKKSTPPTERSISGCKFEDSNNNEIIDDGEERLGGWVIELLTCPYPLDTAYKSVGEGSLVGGCEVIASTTTEKNIESDNYGCYEFNNLDASSYRVREVQQEGWLQTVPVDQEDNFVDLISVNNAKNIDFANYRESDNGFCGDGVQNGEEECDGTDGVGDGKTCSEVCTLSGGGGGEENDCGNGNVESNEQCDDGNLTNGDGCSASCTSEGGGGGTPAWLLTSRFGQTPVVLGESGAPQLAIGISTSKTFANKGDVVTFKIVVANNGNLAAFDTVIKAVLPAGFTMADDGTVFQIASVGSNASATMLTSAGEQESTWEVGDLDSGKVQTIEFKAKVEDSSEIGLHKVSAFAQASNNSQVSDNLDCEVRGVSVLGIELPETGFSISELAYLLATLLVLSFLRISYARDVKM